MMDSSSRPLTVAILGGGTVGAEVARLMEEQSEDLEQRVGARLVVAGVGVRDSARPRIGIRHELLTSDLTALVDARPDIVVELLGGLEPAGALVLRALHGGASVVTANKALVATEGTALHAAAAQSGVDLFYEAAVAGAIPLLRPLRESLAGDRIQRVIGIVNGTTNYILSQMDATGTSFESALRAAQALGYAEADPTADIAGHDAAAKAAILASLAFHTRVSLEDVDVEGIMAVRAADIAAARQIGFEIKLLAIADRIDGSPSGVCVRVHPTLVPRTHPLAGVRDAFNAVFIEAEAAGQVMFYGRGAGGAPTASAVLGDIVAAARNRVSGSTAPGVSSYADLAVLPIGAATTAYFLHLRVCDKPGVLAAVAGAFADHGASIRSLTQRGESASAELLVLTHPGRESDLAATVDVLSTLPSVHEIVSVMRVIGDGA